MVQWSQVFLDQMNKDRERKQAFSDERRKAAIAESMGTANNLHKSLALLLNPDTMQPLPGKEAQAAQIRQQLGQVDNHIRNLYNPNFDPDSGMTHEDPLHKLGDKLHLTKPPAGNRTAGQQMADLKGIQDRYGESASPILDAAGKRQEQEQNIESARALLKKYGASDEVINDITAGMIGGYKATPQKQKWDLVQGTVDGKPVSWLKDQGSGKITDLDGNPVASDLLQKFVATPKNNSIPKVGSLGEFLTNAYGPHPTPQQEQEGRKLWAQAAASETVGTHMVLVPQPDGSIKVLQVETTSKKVFPGAAAAKSDTSRKETKPAGTQIKDLAAIRAKYSGVQSGDVVGGRKTPAQNKADTAYADAVGLAKLADLDANEPTAESDKNLVLTMIRSAAGRVNLQEIAMMRGEAGFVNKLEQWANNVESGKLPDDVRNQIVNLVHQKVEAAMAERDAAYSSGGSSNAPTGNRNPYR